MENAPDIKSKSNTQKLYRHSSVTTTIRYQANFIHQDTDAALDKGINY